MFTPDTTAQAQWTGVTKTAREMAVEVCTRHIGSREPVSCTLERKDTWAKRPYLRPARRLPALLNFLRHRIQDILEAGEPNRVSEQEPTANNS